VLMASTGMLQLIRVRRAAVAGTYSLALLENVCTVAYPALTGRAVDDLVRREFTGLTMLVAVWLVHLVLSVARQRIDTRVFMRLYAEIASHLVRVQQTQGHGTSKVSARVEMVRDIVGFFEKEVPADELEEEVSSYVNDLTKEISGRTASSNALAAKLFDTLVGPVVPAIKAGDVVCIIPDKFLHRLPFAALVSPATGKYLIEEWTVFYAPSLNVLWHCSETGREKAPSSRGTVLSIGNPAFEFIAGDGFLDVKRTLMKPELGLIG